MNIENKLGKTILLIAFFTPTMVFGQSGFLARITPQEGVVEMRSVRGGWSQIEHVVYLVNGNAIRTREDSTALVEISGTEYGATMNSSSQLEVADNQVDLVRGEFVNNQVRVTNLTARLQEKLRGAFQYVTQRRQGPCQPVIRTARNVTLSSAHPELVWQNACPRYTYRLTIDDHVYEIADAGEDDIVSYTVSEVTPGPHAYRVEILENNRVIYTPATNSTFEWVTRSEAEQLASQIAALGDDVFAQSDLLEDKGFLVATMHLYRDFFQNHSEENYLRPLLIKAYAELGLYNLQSEEVRLYNSLRDI